MLSLASRFCFIAAIGLLVWVVVDLALSGDSASSGMALSIEEPERDLGEKPTGVQTVAFRVRNTTGQPQRIVGLAEG